MKVSEAIQAALTNRWAGQRTGDSAYAMAQRCLRWLGDRKASRVRESDLRRMVLAMRASGLGPATCNRHLSALVAALREAGVEVKTPWQREPKGRTRWLTNEEVRQLAMACAAASAKHGRDVSRLVVFLAETGLRVGEALALTWADLELEGPRPHATLRQTKNGDPRWVPLTPDAVQAARTQSTDTQSVGPWYGLSQSVVNHTFRAARDAVSTTRGDREVVVHTLRHTAASRLVQAGVSLPVVATWLGHRDHRSTLRYTHVGEQGLMNAVRLLQESK